MADQGLNPAKAEVLTRLRRVEGQIRGIQRMIEDNRTCEAVVTQLMAARAALDGASLVVMSQHIEYCLLSPNERASRAQLERVISFFLKFAGAPPEGTLAALAEDDSSADESAAQG
jgi:DNA-binding FrmR family transcriptional regulator